jgi:hypothetical protein
MRSKRITRIRRLAWLVLVVTVAAIAVAQSTGPQQTTQETPQQAKEEAQKPDTKAAAGDLAKAVQNPVASLISVPVQNITDFNIGSYQRDRNTVLQFQPVIPMQLGKSWNLITRIIAPVISQPDITQPHRGTSGLGDMKATTSPGNQSSARIGTLPAEMFGSCRWEVGSEGLCGWDFSP